MIKDLEKLVKIPSVSNKGQGIIAKMGQLEI